MQLSAIDKLFLKDELYEKNTFNRQRERKQDQRAPVGRTGYRRKKDHNNQPCYYSVRFYRDNDQCYVDQ